MRNSIWSFVRRALSDQRGQTLPFVALGMVALLGTGGLVVDVGHAYVVRSQLQNSANAAALAASGSVYNNPSGAGSFTPVANTYDCASGSENNTSGVTCVQSINSKCFTSLLPPGETCSGAPANGVIVTNQATVKTYLMALFGVPALNVSATATASIQGVSNSWNVAVIVDGTSSMSTADTNCGGLTEFQCALSSVQVFLEHVNPGATGRMRVSLFSFPNITYTGWTDTSTCGGSHINDPYTLPTPGASTYAPITYTHPSVTQFMATYQMAAWDSNYYDPTNSATAGLKSTDNLVQVIGANYNTSTGSKDLVGCLPDVGGESTYIASVIYAAQNALIQEQAANPTSQNAMIILSDGQAQAPSTSFPSTSYTTTTNGGIVVTYAGTSTWSSTAKNLAGVAGGWGTYPDYNDECQQEIKAAQSAVSAGTRVFTVAYGSEDTGCGSGGTDTHLLSSSTFPNVPVTSLSQLTPCTAMANMADSMSDFYVDPNQSGSSGSCADSVHTTSTLADIALAIASNFTTPRLIPNNSQ